MKNILKMLKESLLDTDKGTNDENWKIAKGSLANNNSCAPVIHPDATNGTIGTLLCGAMTTVSLLVYYFCN
ncbi:MAG: hypothetical protein ACUZ8E_05480 [Candidatus Anammoxibacter sp.]